MKKWLLLACILLTGCSFGSDSNTDQAAEQERVSGKVFYVDSYHEGYAWSDLLTKSIEDSFANTGVELRSFKLDTNRHTDEEFRKNMALEAKRQIEAFHPDVIIATDDNATKYLIEPYFKDAGTPVVFAGINWDISGYGLPYSNTTGMIEVHLVDELISKLSVYSKGSRIGFLSGDDISSRKSAEFSAKVFGLNYETRLVSSFEDFKKEYLAFQDSVDMLYIHNNQSIGGWDDDEAGKFVFENARIPSGTTSEWMAPLVLIGLSHDAAELGEWSAQTAMEIIGGKKPSDIPITKNKRGQLQLNLKMADLLKITFSPSLIKNASEIIE
jgi:ABC-type uncharacterized transport system substrate-binding protein